MIDDRGVVMMLMVLLVKYIPYAHASFYFSFFVLLF